MAFSRTWDAAYEAIPADTDQAKEGALRIRNLKVDIKERAEIDHEHTDDTDGGFHKKATLIEQASDPTFIANKGIVYAKDVAGITELFYIDSGGNVLQITTAGTLKEATVIPPRGHIDGLTLSNAADAAHDITVAVGEAADSTRTNLLERITAITKQLDNAWIVGDNVGGLFTGAIAANTQYHKFLIRKDSDGSIDAGFDPSVAAAAIPAGYSQFRRVGSVKTDGASAIKPFTQVKNRIWWTVPPQDLSTSSAAEQTPVLQVPIDVRVDVIIAIDAVKTPPPSTDVFVNAGPTDATLLAAASGAAIVAADIQYTGQSPRGATQAIITTDTLGKIKIIGNGCTYRIRTHGYYEHF